ncbi:MAG: hypothetical protein ABIG44_19150, partial [Planctomycetota bacterium]
MNRKLCCLGAVLLCAALVAQAGDGVRQINNSSSPMMLRAADLPNTGNTAAMTSSRVTSECPAGETIFSQPALGTGTAANSDLEGGYKIWDNYSTYTAIEDIHWWSIGAYYSAGWYQCAPPSPDTFLIEFWNDNGSGMPDTTMPV